jgi:copper transport protein
MLAATAITLLLSGPRDDNASWAAVLRLRGIGQTLTRTSGYELIARAALLLLAIPLLTAFRTRNRRHAIAGATVALLLLIDTASTGHEAVGNDVALALPAAVLHLAAMAVWLGGLAVLTLVVLPDIRRGGTRTTARDLKRWSYTAYCCVAVLVVTGEYQAARQITPVQALWSTSYGLILLIKVAIVALILAAALIAQRRVLALRPPPSQDAPEAIPATVPRTIARSVRIEAALGIAVIAATALLVSQPPARTTYGPAVSLTAPLGNDRAHIHIDTTRRGREHITVNLTDTAGKPVTAQSITAQLSSSDVAALNATLAKDTPTGTGWRSDVAVPLPGTWTLTLTVTLDPTDAYATAIHYRVW